MRYRRLAFGLFTVILMAGGAVAQEKFPELRPDLKAPEESKWTFRDRIDFYTWTLAEDKKVGERPQSGFGIYFGFHPDLNVDKKVAKRVKGTAFNQEVSWWEQKSDDPKSPPVRREALLTYRHGKEYLPLELHVWIWAETDERVAELEGWIKSLKFELRSK
jgi:hypothetical protein